jgi:hypothetical protein
LESIPRLQKRLKIRTLGGVPWDGILITVLHPWDRPLPVSAGLKKARLIISTIVKGKKAFYFCGYLYVIIYNKNSYMYLSQN